MEEMGRKGYPQLLPVIEFHNVALSNRSGEAVFYYSPEMPGLSGLKNRPELLGPAIEMKVPLTTLDEI